MKKRDFITVKDFDGRVLVSYLYEKDKCVPVLKKKEDGTIYAEVKIVKGKRKGVVVSIGEGIIGWSLCKTNTTINHDFYIEKGDVFDKEVGIDKALRRAILAAGMRVSERASFYSTIHFSLAGLYEEMDERSRKYFKYDLSDLPKEESK